MIKKSAIKKLSIAPYDTAEYLKTEEDMAAYLEACIEEAGDDPVFIAQALGTIARAKGMTQLARDTGLARESLYKALSAARTTRPSGNVTGLSYCARLKPASRRGP